RKEATDLWNAAAAQAAEAERDLADSISKFSVYGSEDALADAEARAAAVAKRFPAASGGTGPLEQQARQLVGDVKAARSKFDLERAAPEVRRLSRLAALLEQEQGFEPIAATYYLDILRRFQDLAAAGPAEGDVAKQVEEVRQHYDALKQKGFEGVTPVAINEPPPAPPTASSSSQ